VFVGAIVGSGVLVGVAVGFGVLVSLAVGSGVFVGIGVSVGAWAVMATTMDLAMAVVAEALGVGGGVGPRAAVKVTECHQILPPPTGLRRSNDACCPGRG